DPEQDRREHPADGRDPEAPRGSARRTHQAYGGKWNAGAGARTSARRGRGSTRSDVSFTGRRSRITPAAVRPPAMLNGAWGLLTRAFFLPRKWCIRTVRAMNSELEGTVVLAMLI